MCGDIVTNFTVGGIVDSTLREGIQAPGLELSFENKIEVICMLNALGVDEIELGVASPRSPELVPLVTEASHQVGSSCRLSLWSRCRDEDISYAFQCQPDILSLSVPVSDLHLHERMRRNRQWVIETLDRSIKYAFDMGFQAVSVGLEDATRADFSFLAKAVETLSAAGATRLRLADTVGISSPAGIATLVRKIVALSPVPVGVHTHNDFGMATANAVAALESGAQWIDATVLGLGERSGNCRLEEIVGYLSLIRGNERYEPKELVPLCRTIARVANISISPHHPVIGEDIFTCETGLHVHGLSGNPETYEPYDPDLIGRKRIFRFGGQTGKRAVQSRLFSLGIKISDEEAEGLVVRIRQIFFKEKKLLGDEELIELVRQQGLINRDQAG